MNLRHLTGLVVLLFLLTSCREGWAGIVETWETPGIAAGSSTASLPSPWTTFSGGGNARIVRPDTTADFNQIGPLAGPAGGSQFLSLSGVNTGVSLVTNEIIRADTTYTLGAAIGNGRLSGDSRFWSLQLWAGSVGGSFIGQRFGTQLEAVNPAQGEWAYNSYSFRVPTSSELVGKRLVVFLNNFGNGTSSYDNVTLTAVPEPSSILLLGPGLAALVVPARQRWSSRRS